MSNGCTVIRVKDDLDELYIDGAGRTLFSEDKAKRIAWTLAHDSPGCRFEVLEHGNLVESFVVGDRGWRPVLGELSRW